MTPALGEGPKRAQGPRQERPGIDPKAWNGCARRPVRSLHAPPQQLGRLAKVADGLVCQPQVIGGSHLHGTIAECGREFAGLLACCNGAVVVSRDPEYGPSQPA